MKRVAFKMKLKPGFAAEYKLRHNEIWPELAQLIIKNGIGDYSIFLAEDQITLFAFQMQSSDFSANNLSRDSIMKKWWAYMSDIMEVNEDQSPIVFPLEEVFYLN